MLVTQVWRTLRPRLRELLPQAECCCQSRNAEGHYDQPQDARCRKRLDGPTVAVPRVHGLRRLKPVSPDSL